MKRAISRAVLCLLICLAILSVEGIYAIFDFADLPADPYTNELYFDIDPFDYPPEEVLPGGGNTSVSLGENHLKLIINLVEQKDYGLNATKKPIIHTLLENPGDLIYSDQQVTTGNLKFLMPSFSSETELLYFVITKISDTEYHAFTLLDSDRYLPIGTEVETYKTLMIKGDNGKWAATVSYVGYAPVNDPANGSVSRAVDITKWRPQ